MNTTTTEPVTRRRYVVEPARAAGVDVDELVAAIGKKRPQPIPSTADSWAYIHCIADWQIGKEAYGQGSEQTVGRILDGLDATVARIKREGKRRPIGTIVLASLGDLCEGVVSQNGGVVLASDLGLTLDLRPVAGVQVMDRLNAGECDLAIAGMAIDPSRLLQVWMTNPYAESDIRVVASAKVPFRTDQLNVTDSVVGVVTGTLAADAARSRLPSATFREFPDLVAAQRALDDGAINALAFKEPIPTLTVAAAKPQRYAVGDGPALARTADAMALRKGDTNLLNFLNGWISARRRDGPRGRAAGRAASCDP